MCMLATYAVCACDICDFVEPVSSVRLLDTLQVFSIAQLRCPFADTVCIFFSVECLWVYVIAVAVTESLL